jgi:hypothetical protein
MFRIVQRLATGTIPSAGVCEASSRSAPFAGKTLNLGIWDQAAAANADGANFVLVGEPE